MSNIRSNIGGNKAFADYGAVLKQMWVDHVASNVSEVICEDANANKKQPKVKDTAKLCDCPGSEPGKIKVGADKHLTGCQFKKRSGRYAADKSVVPDKITDGFCLGFIIGGEQL